VFVMPKAILSILGAAALGAGAMYFYDPKHGTKRRAQVSDGAAVAKKRLLRAADSTKKTLSSKASSVLESSRRAFMSGSSATSTLWSPRTRALLATAGLALAAVAGVRPQS
jgi:hypothetical protein